MMLPSPKISTHRVEPIAAGWRILATSPGTYSVAADIPAENSGWRDAIVPGTVAQAIHTDIHIAGPYDQQDWWYRTEFSAPSASASQHRLRFEGLATIAEVWLNGELILSSQNMFCAHVVDVTKTLRDRNELLICFRSLSTLLEQKRPRPRWKTALTNHQNLRWVRTTLLGRMPAWSPPINPVGPWRPITLESVHGIDVDALNLQTELRGTTGIVNLQATLSGTTLTRAELIIGNHRALLDINTQVSQQTLTATIEIADAPRWWPHTHGAPTLLPCQLELVAADQTITIDCGNIGFKSVVVDRSDDRVQFIINGIPVFCRGACWTINDFVSLTGTHAELRQALELFRDANMNMLRIGGTMTYESPYFFELCDELGIMIWQDFMFANMDYPVDDPTFAASIDDEVKQQLNRLQGHACVTVYCAGSEIEQQAAMMGLPANVWTNSFFATKLPQLCNELHRGIPYFRGSPSEGALPFHVSRGIAHYYGIGAYRRPLSDAKYADVKFASECLGISNIPEPETVALLLDGVAHPVPHHPRWKARVPRDNGSGYDFEDIRDFYLHALFGLDPVKLRSENVDRYYAISRAVSGEVMLRAYAEWRRADNPCSGALIWFYKDLWPGAGWGVIDSENRPKAALHYLRRALAPQTVLMTDEGQDGLKLHIINESANELEAELTLEMYRAGRTRLLCAEKKITVGSRSNTALFADEVIGHFTDIAYNYRFGPPKHDVVIARLRCTKTGAIFGEDYFFPTGHALPEQRDPNIEYSTQFEVDGNLQLTLRSDVFLQCVTLNATGAQAQDNYFHLAPNIERTIHFIPTAGAFEKFKVSIDALNISESIVVRASRAP